MEEPPTGSVVAIDWGGYRQEIWVSNKSNIGNWYCSDFPWGEKRHPIWDDVLARAKGRSLDLLVVGDDDTYWAGYEAGAKATADAIERVMRDAQYDRPPRRTT